MLIEVSLKTVKKVASRVFKVGETRIKIIDEKKAETALTADDVRNLEKEGAIVVVKAKSVGRGKARARHAKKTLGRRSGQGRHKGTPNARMQDKKKWIARVRSQRKFLEKMQATLVGGAYQKIYRMVKGGFFNDKKHLAQYVSENKLKVEKQ